MRTHNIFVSHSWNYGDRYAAMMELLYGQNYFRFRNYSVPETKAFGLMAYARMQEELRQQIRPTHCVIIIGGMWFNHSDWIQFEMDEAERMGKPILGVRPRGAQRMPVQVASRSDEVVNWNGKSIADAVKAISLA